MPVGHLRLGQLTACSAGRDRPTSVAATSENIVTSRFRLTRRPVGAAHGSGLRLGHSLDSQRGQPATDGLAMVSAYSVASRQNTSVFGRSHARKENNPTASAYASASLARKVKRAQPHREGLQRCPSATYGFVSLQRAQPTRPISVAATSENTITSRFRRTRASSGGTAGHAPTSRFRLGMATAWAYSKASWRPTASPGLRLTAWPSDVTVLPYSETSFAMISACSVASRQNASVFGSSHIGKHSDSRFRLTRRPAWADKRSMPRLAVKAYSDARRPLTAWSAYSMPSRQETDVGSSHMRKHSDPAGSAGASAS